MAPFELKSIMSSLSAAQSSGFEAQLRLQRAALLERIRNHLNASGDPGKLSLADRLEESGDWTKAGLFSDTDIALLGHELAGLRDTDAALRRIADGAYGVCIECGEEIARERLKAQPAARLCLACKQAFEQRRGIVRNGGMKSTCR
jgi:DnaK suppressor protein